MSPGIVLTFACGVLTVLWALNIRYPIISDTAGYALLGESVWNRGTYSLLGVPHARHLPLHAILSYPFVLEFGYNLGMKIASLVAGFFVLASAFTLLNLTFSRKVALLATALLPLHHGFVFMASVGSADLLFCALFLLSLVAYVRAETDTRWYVGAGFFAGLACLTRYNGAPLFALFFVHAFLARKSHIKEKHFWVGGLLGMAIFSLWFVRNTVTLGGPFVSEYGEYLEKRNVHYGGQFFSNLLYYGNPLQNILPILFLFSLYGLAMFRGKYKGFLILSLAAAWILTSVWPVQAIRFAFPGYPILIGFAAWGMADLYDRTGKWKLPFTAAVAAGIAFTHMGALCLYSLGECNAWYDRAIAIGPAQLGVSMEGMQSWHEARTFINKHAPKGATVLVDSPIHERVWASGVFRDDITVTSDTDKECNAYRIVSPSEKNDDSSPFTSFNQPALSVVQKLCSTR